jgi:hypothetical protein
MVFDCQIKTNGDIIRGVPWRFDSNIHLDRTWHSRGVQRSFGDIKNIEGYLLQ